MTKAKFYVVWKGRRRGVYSSWAECERQVKGFVGAEYKGFRSREAATQAFTHNFEQHRGRAVSPVNSTERNHKPRLPSLCVDAACSGSPGRLEYRGVYTQTRQQAFRAGPFEDGTNNVGEFLAIVAALKWLDDHDLDWPIYSDSENAISWVRARECNTRLKRTAANRKLFSMIARAETELRTARVLATGASAGPSKPVLKWETKAWGENPADFGRK